MTKAAMHIDLSTSPAELCWGKNALLSACEKGIIIHLTSNEDALSTIQRAGRKINKKGIHVIKLIGNYWNLEYCWAFWQGYRSPKTNQHITWPTMTEEMLKELNRRLHVINWVRDTINAPAEELSPKDLAQSAVDIISSVSDNPISYHMITSDALYNNGYMGLHAIGRSSERPPVLLTVDYNPGNNPNSPVSACLVGKGITFDTGGYSLKSSKYMSSMKSDMGGAATLTGAIALAISNGLKKRVKLILCCADNMISGNACKPGDIIRYRNGTSVEIMNTDAEGRLVLADGLIDADKTKSKLIIDCATLTGAAKTALGNDYHAFFSFDDILASKLVKSANEENESFWRLPLAELHRHHLPSNFADISNVASSIHSAGASTAAAFLSHFIQNYRHGWLHIDCSAIFCEQATDQWAAGATGVGVRTLSNVLLTRT